MVMTDKKGLSMIVSTLLIILLVLVALGIIWGVVRNVLNEGSDEIGLGKFFVNLDVKQAYLEGDGISVNVERGIGEGELSGMTFVFSDGSNSEVISIDYDLLDELESDTYTFTAEQLGSLNPSNVIEVSVAPIYLGSSGGQSSGEITGSALISDAPEGTLEAGTCGNLALDAGETCDDDLLNSQTCITQGYDLGTLRCSSDCTSFDVSSCPGGPTDCVADTETSACGLQQGVCLDSIQTCDTEGSWPGCVYTSIVGYNEEGETGALCTDELDNDCNGLTDNDELTCEYTWTGTVNDPWPSGALYLFLVENLVGDESEPISNMKIKFASDPVTEERCLTIFDYILPSEGSLFTVPVIQIDENPIGGLPIDLVAGDTFTIYQKSDCGFD
jgi:hypothetical protein